MRRRELILGIGGLISTPINARGQQKTMPVIGVLSTASPGPTVDPFDARFRQGLGETGYVEGQNTVIEYRWAEGHLDRLPALATELTERKVDAIVAGGGFPAASAAKRATAAIPIVFAVGADPVAIGLVASLAHPGGNLTGVSFLNAELTPKRVELLSEVVPRAAIALLVNPNNPATEDVIREVQKAATTKGVQLHVVKAATESDIDAAFASYVQLHAGALIVADDPLFFLHLERLVALASRYAAPAIYPWREAAASGGLISYATSLLAAYHLVGTYVGKILNGTSPADLPVQQPTRFELVLNLQTAKALGLTVPPLLLATADEVIE
jgi:putative ABC transport system substrate-binding protein